MRELSSVDQHNFDERLSSALRNIQENNEIREENKKLAKYFMNWLKDLLLDVQTLRKYG